MKYLLIAFFLFLGSVHCEKAVLYYLRVPRQQRTGGWGSRSHRLIVSVAFHNDGINFVDPRGGNQQKEPYGFFKAFFLFSDSLQKQAFDIAIKQKTRNFRFGFLSRRKRVCNPLSYVLILLTLQFYYFKVPRIVPLMD